MKSILLIAAILLITNEFVEPCALPYWWSEQFHFPPFYPQHGQPKSTYRYRETLSKSDPNNYVHIKEYSEFTWWEHDLNNNNNNNNNKEQGPWTNGVQQTDVNHEGFNRVFAKSGGVSGMFPGEEGLKRMFPGAVDNNGLMPGEAGTNGIVPREDVVQSKTTTTTTTTTSSNAEVVDEREKNDREDLETSRTVDMEGNDVEIRDESAEASTTTEEKRSGNYLSNLFGYGKTINETEPCKVSESDIHSLRSMIEKMFSSPRDHMMHPDTKEKAREDIMKKFKDFGLQVWTQNFTTPPVAMPDGTEELKQGVNLVGVIPGSQRGRMDDGIVLVGAHYDTVADSNGVDDNGSGLAVMLEVARALTQARCRFNNTLMFVAFDHEEDGAMGSNYFVDQYLIPEELKRARAHFQGAFILDGIMNFNDAPNTQELPLDYSESLPGLQYFVNNTGNRGNFLAMISRNDLDSHLTKKLMEAWQDLGEHQYKLFNLAVNMGKNIPSPPVMERHLNFLRSDHATFWYHNSSSHFPDSLNAVLLTDTGPFRGQMRECYHSKCDDLTVMSPEKLQFAKKTADALTATLVELTKATNAGNEIQPFYKIYLIHFVVLFCAMKVASFL